MNNRAVKGRANVRSCYVMESEKFFFYSYTQEWDTAKNKSNGEEEGRQEKNGAVKKERER